jgi:uncharacterized protein involved in exopolysaccharide biosynthesis
MATQNYIRLFLNAWKFMALVTLLGGALAVLFSFAQPLRYSSTERLLILQTNSVGIDPYTALKSTERIAQNLSELIYTSSFFNAVMSKAQVEADYFPQDEISKRKKWRSTIETSVTPGTGIMTITAYHPKRETATELATYVSQQLVSITPNYFGYSVRVQIIDDPLPSKFYAKPDFLRNAMLGLIAGFLLASVWVLGKGKV